VISQRIAATDKLVGYTTVCHLEFNYDSVRSVCDLAMKLENPTDGKSLTLLLKEVSQLRLEEFGGGLTQLLYLLIEDIREAQLDRVSYHVKDVERGIFECQCRDIAISESS
jgi:hypothetical protein